MISKKIKELVEHCIGDDLFVVEVIVNGGAQAQKVLVLMDGDNGITIDQCAKISRHLSEEMDELDFFEGKYKLEVSSPGLDHPIVLHRQYVKNRGRDLAVLTNENEKIMGRLEDVNEKAITLSIKEKKKTKSMEIPLNKILKANILVSFK